MLREQIGSIARGTDRPFCVNLVLDFAQDERLELVVEERVPWVSFSFGLRPALVTRARVGGARVLVQVASADAARAAATAGADASSTRVFGSNEIARTEQLSGWGELSPLGSRWG